MVVLNIIMTREKQLKTVIGYFEKKATRDNLLEENMTKENSIQINADESEATKMQVQRIVTTIQRCFCCQIFILNMFLFYTERELIFSEIESLHFRCFFLGVDIWMIFSINEALIHSHHMTYFYHMANIVWVMS